MMMGTLSRNLGLGLILAAALGVSACKGGGTPAAPSTPSAPTGNDVASAAQGEACTDACDKGLTECSTNCAQEANKDACDVACKAARDKCVEECKKQ